MADWDKDKPADNDLVSQFPSNERDARDAVRVNFQKNHHAGDDADVGKHEIIEILANTTPTAASGQGNCYTKDVGSGQIELFYQDAAGNEIRLTFSGAPSGFESGTKCVFYQASAPTGWTQDTSVTDRVLRVVDGSGGGTGGSWTISGVTVDGHQLSVSEMPSHNHGGSTGGGGSHSHSLDYWYTTESSIGADQNNKGRIPSEDASVGRFGDGSSSTAVNSVGNHSHGISSQGGGGSHSHGLTADGNWRPEYIDVIVASKD